MNRRSSFKEKSPIYGKTNAQRKMVNFGASKRRSRFSPNENWNQDLGEGGGGEGGVGGGGNGDGETGKRRGSGGQNVTAASASATAAEGIKSPLKADGGGESGVAEAAEAGAGAASKEKEAAVEATITKLPSINAFPKESLLSDTTIKSLRKSRVSTKEEPFQVWDKTGSLLGPGYLKGLTTRIVGNSQNLAEHKLLEVNLNIMRKQRAQVMHSWDARLKREQQIIINNKAEWEMRKMRGRKKTAKAKLAIEKAKEALQEAMSRPLNRAFIHRFTKGSVETVADLAKGRHFMASHIRQTLHGFKDILSKIGINGEIERKNAELLLQMRDHLEGLSAFEPEFLRKLQLTLPPDSPPDAFEILVDQIKVQRREELLTDYEKAFFKYIKTKSVGKQEVIALATINNNNQSDNFNDNNATDAMKEALAQLKREQVSAQLYNQSLLLQSHPYVTAAILLGKEIPYGYGGLGNRGDKKEEVVEVKVKKKAREDSMDMFGLDDDDSGMCTVRDVFVAMNMIETKDVNDRISEWLTKMETEKAAAEEVGKNREANAKRNAALAMLASGAS